jgi:tRNA G10  N-methylase Trm11
MQSLVILGRQPALGLAELESLYGPASLQKFSSYAALLDMPVGQINFDRLGGSTRLCKVLSKVPNDWTGIRNYLLAHMPEHAASLPDGKLTFGISLFGVKVHVKELERGLLEMKKVIKRSGRPVRLVPNKQLELNSAQVIHNKLADPGNWELVIVSDGRETYLTQTVRIQDIEKYAARDQARPMRDAKVGMLPPKLAQIIINLATGPLVPPSPAQPDGDGILAGPVLDPFCGTGVVLQEATLMGYDSFGTDLEPRMVEYSIANLHWLRQKWDEADTNVRIELGDATTHKWKQPIGAVAGETYLGNPYASLPPRDVLQKNIRYVDDLHRKFLRNIHKQLASGTHLCLAVPAWSTKQGFLHLPVLDQLKELGYNETKFVHAGKAELVYHRENQVVARELVVITKE